jgi:hypothetical protein
MFSLLALAEPATIVNKPFNLDVQDFSSQLKVSSAAGIELMKVYLRALRLMLKTQSDFSRYAELPS